MQRRTFIAGGLALGVGTAIGLHSLGGEGAPPDLGPEQVPAMESADDNRPDLGDTQQPTHLSGNVAGLFVGVTPGDRLAALSGQPTEIDLLMSGISRFGNMTTVEFTDAMTTWEDHDAAIRAAGRYGMGVTATIKYMAPAKIADFAGEIAERYGSANGGALGGIILGEAPNTYEGWGSEPNVDDYVDFFVRGARAIQETDAGVGAITANVVPASDNGEQMGMGAQIAPVTYVDQVLTQLKDGGYLDLLGGIGYAPYNWNVPDPNQPDNAWRQLSAGPNTADGQTETLRSVLESHNLAQLPVYLTYGAPTSGPDSISPTRQEELIRNFLTREVPGVVAPVRLVQTYKDSETVDLDNPQAYFGVLDAAGNEKLAGTTMAALVASAR